MAALKAQRSRGDGPQPMPEGDGVVKTPVPTVTKRKNPEVSTCMLLARYVTTVVSQGN